MQSWNKFEEIELNRLIDCSIYENYRIKIDDVVNSKWVEDSSNVYA